MHVLLVRIEENIPRFRTRDKTAMWQLKIEAYNRVIMDLEVEKPRDCTAKVNGFKRLLVKA